MTKENSSTIGGATLHIFGGGELAGTAEKIALRLGWKAVLRTGQRFVETLPKLDSSTQILVGDDLRTLIGEGKRPEQNDFAISFSAPWIFPQDVIDMFPRGFFNLHSQPLPKFRGGGGTSWSILMNDRRGGCCIHRLVKKIDAGEIFARSDFRFPDECRFPVDYDKYGLMRAKVLLEEWLSTLLQHGHSGPEIKIDESESEYWPRLNADIHGWIDWSWGLNDIEAFCDAFSFPHGGARTQIRGAVVRFKRAKAVVGMKFHPFQRGLVFRIDKDGAVAVAHPEGILHLEEFSVEGDYAKVRLGDRFVTPAEKLAAALACRVQYLPSGKVVEI